MTKEEAIEYFKFHRKIFCEDYLKICPKDSIAYQATLKEKEFYDMAIKSLEQEPRWIPVSKKMPEEAYACLVTVLDINVKTQEEFENILPYFVGYDGETWNNIDGEPIPFEVIAWMPVPLSKAYSEEEK